MDEEKDVYGETYSNALARMQILHAELMHQKGKGFRNHTACAEWARAHCLDLIVLSRSTKQFYNVTHHGDILIKKAWLSNYNDILFIKDDEDDIVYWSPNGFEYHDKARVNGEKEEQGRQPLYHRDYTRPAGYYDPSSGTFNIARPFAVFAKQTGRDTSHVYTFINAIAGECALHLLAWLRMKMVDPKTKTQVVPIIVSRAQGTGKTTFAEVICKGLFGKDNVLVTDQYDSGSRFNADYADALIVCHEEKEYEDKRNSAAALKSRATATTIRKEHKGLDPVYQESYTDFIMTSNKDVPIKFDDAGDQRRFMVMEADETFTRVNPIADDVFTKLYGYDIHQVKVGIPFVEDDELIAQFKHELYSREDIKDVKVRDFPHTHAYNRCFTLPRTSEATEIESIIHALAPFIKASLEEGHVISTLVLHNNGVEENVALSSYLQTSAAFAYYPSVGDQPAYVALCRPLVFFDYATNKAFNHATVERCMYDCDPWLIKEYGIRIYPVTTSVPGGFYGVQGRHRMAPTARFCLAHKSALPQRVLSSTQEIITVERIGERLRVNNKWRPDPEGEYETLNEMKPGTKDLIDKNHNVQYMDTFLFEADETDKVTFMLEQQRIEASKTGLTAGKLFVERLRLQLHEADILFKKGIAARVVYSGGKSYHIVVRIGDEPSTLEEYKWIHAALCQELSDKLIFDPTTVDPARLTRAPITKVREFEYMGVKVTGQQRPVYTDWNHVYNFNWRPLYKTWLNRPLAPYEVKRRLVPCKLEYKEAMYALLNGTFWTDSIWHGRRQQCFFPAYRLCRYLGYSHDQLWAVGGILDGLDNYYRKSDIGYWQSREQSAIVADIDRDIEEMESECDL